MKKPLKTVGVKELKNNLSSYLREVRGGASVLVTDRNNIVAELHEPYTRPDIAGSVHPLLLSWAESGSIRLPLAGKEPLALPGLRNPVGTVKSILENDRKESGD